MKFDGQLPEAYDSLFRPLLFDPYARWFADRMRLPSGARVLEIAAGTGALSEAILRWLPPDGKLMVTDLHSGMLKIAREEMRHDLRASFEVANAQELPFPDESFDLVVCQFGYMFFPDKRLACHEAHRVLARGGAFQFLVWNSVEQNEIVAVIRDAMASVLGEAPKGFSVPHLFGDRETIEGDLRASAFSEVNFEDVVLPTRSTPLKATRAFCRGTPTAMVLKEMGDETLAAVEEAVERRVGERFGVEFETDLSALFVDAR